MNDNWIFFQEINFDDPSIMQYHIDTRDFCCLTMKKVSEKTPDLSKIQKYPERFFFSGEEAKALLNRYFIESGGKKKWRFLSIKGLENWQLKYIRIHRTQKGLVVCNSDNHAIKKETLNLPIDQEFLHAH